MADHRGFIGGHPVVFQKDGRQSWVYEDTGEPARLGDRPCAHCGLEFGPDGIDPCVGGRIEGAVKVCCGHGGVTEAYINFEDGSRQFDNFPWDKKEPTENLREGGGANA